MRIEKQVIWKALIKAEEQKDSFAVHKHNQQTWMSASCLESNWYDHWA